MPEEPPVPSTSRRRFLIGTGAGAGASVLGVAAAPAAHAAGDAAGDGTDGGTTPGSLVAYVSDVARGRISVLADGREVTVTDPALARSLARKAR